MGCRRRIAWYQRPRAQDIAAPNRPGRFTHVTQLVRQRRSVTGGRRHCAAPADGTGARSRSFPPAGLAGSRGLPRSPGPQVPADHLRDADVLLGRADQQDTLEFRVQAPDVSRRRSVVLPYRRCMPARNRAPPPAGRACRYARHARTWPTALATRRHNDQSGTQRKRSSDGGAAGHIGCSCSRSCRQRWWCCTCGPSSAVVAVCGGSATPIWWMRLLRGDRTRCGTFRSCCSWGRWCC